MAKKVLGVVLGCVVGASCGGRGGDLSSPTAPSNPQNTNLSGTWTGTMARPAGLGAIAVRWTVTQNDNNLTGPVSLTYNGLTIEAVMAGSWGSNQQAPMIGFLRVERPANSTPIPNCGIIMNGVEFRGFSPASTTLTSNTFPIRYDNCQGFVAPDPPTTSRSETSQLTLNR